MGFDFTLPGLGRPESSRPKRVGEAVRHELTELLLQRVRDPRLREVVITGVRMSPDLKLARVYYDVHPGQDLGQVRKALEKAKGFMRSHLARKMNMRYTPDLVFYHDRQNEESQRLEDLFREIAAERSSDDEGPV
ncbi:MAG: 30S ribosome-binding factor RbfA [Desulfobulbaceae bacterium]